MNQIRILHLIDSLAHGGAEHQLALTVGGLDRSKFSSVVCHLHAENDLAKEIRDQGVRVVGLDIPRGFRHWAQGIRKVRGLVSSLNIDLIHTSLFESDVIGGLAGKTTGIPVIGTLCSVGGEPQRLIDNPHGGRWRLRVTTWFWGMALRRLHVRSIAISKTVKRSAVETYGLKDHRVDVVYRAMPESWFENPSPTPDEGLRSSLGLDSARPLILNVGRLVPAKGQRYLIEALPQILARMPDARLVMVGDGILRESLTTLARDLNVQMAVSFLGTRNDVRDLLALSDLFVFPSVFEGLGVSLLEASGLGKPCIASRIGALEEIIEDGVSGLLVSPQAPNEIAEAVVALASDPSRAKALGVQARATVRRQFSLPSILRDVERIYSLALEQDGTSSPTPRVPATIAGNR